MPALKNTLQKAIDDNFLLSDTCEDDFVLNILKQNLGLLLELVHILKEVLDFFAAQGEICLVDIKYTAITSIEIISSTYDHCRNSSETYKVNFNEDLLDIFKVMQEVHSIYLQIFDTSVILSEALQDDTEKNILLKVLDNLCTVSQNLFFLNLKLLATNWKGYIGIAQKFLDILKDQLDLRKPIGCLASIIDDNLSSLNDPENIKTPQIVQLTGFLVKVILKLLDIFWDSKEKNVDMIMEFCCSIYSFTPHIFSMLEYPLEIIQLIDDTIFAHMKPFVWKFMQEEQFLQGFQSKTSLLKKFPFGLLNVLNVCLEGVVMVENSLKIELDILIRLIFECCKPCFKEYFWPENNFDDLVVHIAAAVITHDIFYAKIEVILLENILQEEIWTYLLATETWCLILRNSNPRLCADTLLNLVKIYDQLNFGVNTHRLENIYLISFMRRVFGLLPDFSKSQMSRSVYAFPRVWKKIGFQHFNLPMKNIVEDVQSKTIESFENIGRDNFTTEDLINLVGNLEALSTVNYQELNLSHVDLVNTIASILELPLHNNTNDTFKYFIASFCKITNNYLTEFNNKQLYTILNQLALLSSNEFFKIHVCFALRSFCYVNKNKLLGQDGRRIFGTIVTILSNLLNSNNVVKQTVLELLEVLVQNGKEEIVKNTLMNCGNNEIVELVSNFLRKNVEKQKFNTNYFNSIGELKYRHNCVMRTHTHTAKKLKLDIDVPHQNRDNCAFRKSVQNVDPIQVNNNIEEQTATHAVKLRDYKHRPKSKMDPPVVAVEDSKGNEDDGIDEVLCRIKGEIKCLTRALKTEKLSSKNVSDLKIITSQLSSLM
ncbi:uncharacterized protein LOC114332074 [Diabrotica virgifera virgifera]|uniref:Uncharacterized protein n=2 Tax=Diabrotica virgifera virgifera TaxID=50390 RepID=A0ABM5INR9_DIAVI|nr:uncharacterized protein LOC114332074 [Diabrotica virgifera virgifera]